MAFNSPSPISTELIDRLTALEVEANTLGIAFEEYQERAFKIVARFYIQAWVDEMLHATFDPIIHQAAAELQRLNAQEEAQP